MVIGCGYDRGRGYGRWSFAMVVCCQLSVVVVGQSSTIIIVIGCGCGLQKSMVSKLWTCLNCDQPEHRFSGCEALDVMIHPNFSHPCRTPSLSPYPCLSDHYH